MSLGQLGASSRPAPGVRLAAVTALVSGLSVFVNSYGVRSFHDAASYTTAKNLVAALLLAALATLASRRRPSARTGAWAGATAGAGAGAGAGATGGRPPATAPWRRAVGFAYVAVVGGGLAFVLFFDGLAATSAAPAAFLHDTLVLWVGVACWALRRERPSAANLAAVALLVAGQTALGGGIGHLVASRGALLVLAATLLWSAEVLVAKRLLADTPPQRLGLVRMGGGGLVLLASVAADGHLHDLVGLDPAQAGWVLLTGALLAAYVATWLAALARGRALDVTSVLVGSALVTTALQALAGQHVGAAQLAGLGLVAAGVAAALAAWPPVAPARR